MLVSLIKKDILIIKKYIFMMMILAIIIPVFIIRSMPETSAFSTFMISTIFVELILYQYVSMIELKYPKADALLCAIPYPRHLIVIARYSFLLFIYFCCIFMYSIVGLFSQQIKPLNLFNILVVLMILSIFFGIFIPIQFKIGYEKTKYFVSVVIVATPFLAQIFLKQWTKLNVNWLSSISYFAWNLIILAAIILIISISIVISVKIYKKKELY